MKTVRILGAGIFGLTAAINLAKADYDVEVHEKFSEIYSKRDWKHEVLYRIYMNILKYRKIEKQ